MRELIRARNGEKKWPARKSRKREDNDDFIKTITPRRTPKGQSNQKKSQPIRNSTHLSGAKDFLFSFGDGHSRDHPSGKGGCVFIRPFNKGR
jgi:hypothetical protein